MVDSQTKRVVMMSTSVEQRAVLALQKAQLTGLTFEQYYKTTEQQAQNDSLINLNLIRMKRILTTYTPPTELREKIAALPPHRWVIISESWCGDSAHFVPAFYKLSTGNANIHLSILYRDENPEIMDLYLTNGKRSIPKFIAISNKGKELFTWGPRPAAIQALVEDAKKRGITGQQLEEFIQKCYNQDKFNSFNQEILELLHTMEL